MGDYLRTRTTDVSKTFPLTLHTPPDRARYHLTFRTNIIVRLPNFVNKKRMRNREAGFGVREKDGDRGLYRALRGSHPIAHTVIIQSVVSDPSSRCRKTLPILFRYLLHLL